MIDLILDIKKLERDSKMLGVNIYTLVKRELIYRRTDERDNNRSCMNCRAISKVSFPLEEERTQCLWIGITHDRCADIDGSHICKAYEKNKRRYE